MINTQIICFLFWAINVLRRMNSRDQTRRGARVAFYTFPHFPPQFSFIYELRIIAIMLTKYYKNKDITKVNLKD